MVRDKIIISAIGIGTFGAALFGVNAAFAQTASPNPNPMNSLVQKIAARFNLNPADVQQVFDQDRADHKAERQADFSAKLDQAVKDGKITDAQKTAILDKFSEMKKPEDFEQFKKMTPEQRQQAMQQKKQDLETWAQQNGLSLQTLQDILGHGGGFGMRHHGMWGPKPSPIPST